MMPAAQQSTAGVYWPPWMISGATYEGVPQMRPTSASGAENAAPRARGAEVTIALYVSQHSDGRNVPEVHRAGQQFGLEKGRAEGPESRTLNPNIVAYKGAGTAK